ncbi:aquaporin-1 [Lates japonicus]|uniref:Aquaporin-1 n=1 Tax=Lates japonicus TaxID=270547 RepID=A0AAD3R0X3_LATJO|nr:aquaporin-1 [Lates japonicus]
MLLFIFIGISAIVGKDKNGVHEESIAQELKVSLAFKASHCHSGSERHYIRSTPEPQSLWPAGQLPDQCPRCVCYILAQMLGQTRKNVLPTGPEDGKTMQLEETAEDNGSPGPSQWPKQ